MNNPIFKKNLKNIAIIILIAIFFIADRYLKALALTELGLETINLIGKTFIFSFTPNPFIAFSLPLSGPILTIIVGVTITALLVYLREAIKKRSGLLLLTGLSLIIIGAISNLLDRLVWGYVIDYLYLKNFTVFNLADAYVSLGALLAIIFLIKNPRSNRS